MGFMIKFGGFDSGHCTSQSSEERIGWRERELF